MQWNLLRGGRLVRGMLAAVVLWTTGFAASVATGWLDGEVGNRVERCTLMAPPLRQNRY